MQLKLFFGLLLLICSMVGVVRAQDAEHPDPPPPAEDQSTTAASAGSSSAGGDASSEPTTAASSSSGAPGGESSTEAPSSSAPVEAETNPSETTTAEAPTSPSGGASPPPPPPPAEGGVNPPPGGPPPTEGGANPPPGGPPPAEGGANPPLPPLQPSSGGPVEKPLPPNGPAAQAVAVINWLQRIVEAFQCITPSSCLWDASKPVEIKNKKDACEAFIEQYAEKPVAPAKLDEAVKKAFSNNPTVVKAKANKKVQQDSATLATVFRCCHVVNAKDFAAEAAGKKQAPPAIPSNYAVPTLNKGDTCDKIVENLVKAMQKQNSGAGDKKN